MGLLFEAVDESACPLQGRLVIVDAEEQEEAVARGRVVGAHQRGMFVRAPQVQTEQDGSIGIQDLAKVVMGRSGLALAEQPLVPLEAVWNVAYADDRPYALQTATPSRAGGFPALRRPEAISRYSCKGNWLWSSVST